MRESLHLMPNFRQAKQNEAARRLTRHAGNRYGALNATALVAAIGDAQTFARGRDLVAWLGLSPRQATTGGKAFLLGTTKRGSKYLRKMLIQGTRSALPTLSRTNTRPGLIARSPGARRQNGAHRIGAPAGQYNIRAASNRGLLEEIDQGSSWWSVTDVCGWLSSRLA